MSKRLDFVWGNSTTVVSHDQQVSLCNMLGSVSLEEHAKHLLREVLRTSAWSFESRRRPKDFIGTARGVDMDLARSTYRVEFGLALLTAGSWTAARLYIAALTDSPLCARCGVCWDTKEHRLWWCDDNAAALRHLLDSHPDLSPSDLPPCLRRCGLVPKRLSSCSFIDDVLKFLLESSKRATRALADAHKQQLSELAAPPDDGFPPVSLDLG